MEKVIEINGLSHSYMADTPLSKEALDDVNLSVYRGEVVALVGPTGSGKSTLLQHMNGLYTPQSGSVIVLGHDLSLKQVDLKSTRRSVGLVLQNPGHQLFEQYVGDDVAFGPRMAGYRGKELVGKVKSAMELVGLPFAEFKDRPTYSLSGGERRKAGLAGVLALEPEVLLLDEPAAGLDPSAHEELLIQLETLHGEGKTLVIASHSMDDVARLADRVVVLNRGRIVLEGSTRDIFSKADALEAIGLTLPTAGAVTEELRRHGWDIRPGVLTIEEAETAILEALGEIR